MHRILVHSKQELDIAAQLFPNSKTEQLDMPAVSLKTSTENSCRSEGSLFFDHDGPLALFFGTVRHYKGVDILIRAVSELRTHRPDLRVLIAGEPFGRRGRRIKFLIKLLRLENMVECDFRYIPDSELSLLLDRTTIVVLPFRSITQSASVMLARKHGVPVVTTNLPALQDSAIGDPGIFLVQPDDPRAVASGMLKALEVADGKIHPESELAPKWKDYANRIVPVFEREQFRQAVA